MPDFLKPYISRVIGALVAGFFSWLAAKNINVDGDTQQQALALIMGLVSTLFAVIYAFIHKLLDKTVNPTDGAAKANIEHGATIKADAAMAGYK